MARILGSYNLGTVSVMTSHKDYPVVSAQVAPASERPSDHSLVRRFAHGDQKSATQIYLRYAPRLLALVKVKSSAELVRREDPEDIVQSVFCSFFKGVTQKCYQVPDGHELWKLFLVIALNKIRSKARYHRASKRDVRLPVAVFDQEDKAAQDEASLHFLELVVEETLERLPRLHRTMVELCIAGVEFNEIAKQTARSRRSVERVLQRFRKKLHDLLEK